MKSLTRTQNVNLEVAEIHDPVAEAIEETKLRLAQYTEQGTAGEFAAYSQRSLRYLSESKRWIAYTGTHWSTANGDTIALMLWGHFVSDRLREIASISEQEVRDAALGYWRKALATEKGRRKVLELAKPMLAISREAFDRNADDLLCTPSGTVNLRTGELSDNDPRRMLTQCTTVGYDPKATCPQFAGLVWQIAGQNEQTHQWLCRAIGYTLTGRVHEDTWFYLFGEGSNGKSTLLKMLRLAMGSYACSLDIKFLTAGKDSHSTEYAKLDGKRLVVSTEVERNQKLAESKIKELTGGEGLEPREMHQSANAAKSWYPKLKLWLSGNHDLVIMGTDAGTWRRIQKLSITCSFAHSNVRDSLFEKEGAGILAFAVLCARAWYGHEGLGTCDAVKQATEDYRREQDLLGQFFSDCLVFGDGAFASSSELNATYKAYREEKGQEHAVGPKEMRARLQRAGAREARRHARGWSGVRVVRLGE